MTEIERIQEALNFADFCNNTDEGDLGTGAIVLARAYCAEKERREKAEAKISALEAAFHGKPVFIFIREALKCEQVIGRRDNKG